MRKTALALISVLALVLAACGDDDGDDGVTDNGDTGNGEDATAEFEGEVTVGDDGRLQQAECQGENVAAEGDGVTEDTVNVVALSIDFEPLGAIGFAASDRDPTADFAEFVEELNDNGGVCGRTIDVQRVLYDILQGEAGQACVEATEDRDNLVLNSTGYDEILCITDAGLPAYGGFDVSEAELEDAGGLLLTRRPLVEQQYRAVVQHAQDDGALEGTVGVWYGSVYEEQTQAVEDVVLPMLDELGVEYVEHRTTSAGPSDPEGNAILTAAATDFAAQNVDTMLTFVQNTNHVGMQTELAAQGVNPRWISMPISANVVNELFADRFGTADIADGQEFVTYTRGTTEIGPEDPVAESCHEVWTRRTGEEVEPNTFDYISVATTCVMVDSLAAALSLAGGDLDRERIVQAFEALPAHNVPPYLGDLDWTPQRHYGPSAFSVQDFDGDSITVSTREDLFEIDG